MKSVFTNVIIISNTPEEYTYLKLPVYEDVYKGKGPLAGIHSGLKNSKTKKSFIISCDIPLINKEVIEYIVDFKTDKLISVFQMNEYIHPFPGIYSNQILSTINERLNPIIDSKEKKDANAKVTSFIKSIDTEIINPEVAIGYTENTFLNINTQEDYNNLLAMINK